MNTWNGRWTYLCCFCVLSAFAQQTEPSTRSAALPSDRDAADRNLILDVAVTDKSGNHVTGLQQQDFTILDNKQPQKILSFHAVERTTATADSPVEVVLLIDEVNASFQTVARGQEQIKKFLLRDGGELARPVSLAFLSDSGVTMTNNFSQDGKGLAAGLDQTNHALRVIGRSQGFYGANDRLQLSLRALGQLAQYETRRPGRKIVIWIGPGWPLLSGPRVELSSKDEQRIFDSVVSFSQALRRARITLYSVDPLGTADAGRGQTFFYEEFLKEVTEPKQVHLGNLALQVLATHSGGLVLNSSNDVAGEIAKCVTDANGFYVLSYDGLAADEPNQYHALELTVARPGLKALTRSGYYATVLPTRPR